MLVVLEGPEKVGKTTFSNRLTEWWLKNRDTDVWYVHRPREVNVPHLVEQDLKWVEMMPQDLVIFDRFYPSDLVYRTWDGEPSRFPLNADYMERTYGPWIDRLGLRILLLGDPQELAQRRTSDDVPIDPALEQRLYELVCPHRWSRLHTNHRLGKSWEKHWERILETWNPI